MIHEYLIQTWAYLYNNRKISVEFKPWVNSLTNLQLVEYIDNAMRSGGDD